MSDRARETRRSDWRDLLRGDPLPWLLEPTNPSVRYLTLTQLLDRPEDDPQVQAARGQIEGSRPVQEILAAQYPAGYWMRPGIGYSPKYRATLWQIIFLAELRMQRNEALDRAVVHAIRQAQRPDGHFIANRERGGAILCLHGNLLRALVLLGYGEEPAVQRGWEALAQAVERGGFHCRYNGGLPCAWGAVKALRAIVTLPSERRPPILEQALAAAADFLLAHDPMAATYPTPTRPSPRWFQLGFPPTHEADLLELLEALVAAGRGDDERLLPLLRWLLARQDEAGRWRLGRTPSPTWTAFETVGRPSRWITWRALRLLKRLFASDLPQDLPELLEGDRRHRLGGGDAEAVGQ